MFSFLSFFDASVHLCFTRTYEGKFLNMNKTKQKMFSDSLKNDFLSFGKMCFPFGFLVFLIEQVFISLASTIDIYTYHSLFIKFVRS